MNYNKNVYKTLALITQIGISMLTPILLCVFLSVFLEGKFGFQAFIPLTLLGIAAGGRNCYLLVKKVMDEDKKEP